MEEVIALIQSIPQYKPLVRATLDGLKEYQEEWEEVQQFVVNTTVENKSKIYFGFIEKGVPSDHALALTISSTQELYKGYKEGLASQRKTNKGESK